MRELTVNIRLNNMPVITSDQFRDISVKTVEGFLNDRVPLSEGLAKHASYYEMNSEQVQRAVEATNSIAYLKVLSLADDRTVEFPLCKYAEVMQELTLPKGLLQKSAAVIIADATAMVKSATEKTHIPSPLMDAEKQVLFIKLAALNKRELESLKEEEMFIIPNLIKAAKDLKNDPQALEKLASVATGDEFRKLSGLVFGVTQEYSDTGLFKTAELKEASGLADMLKQAEALDLNIKHKQSLFEKSELQKEAFLGAIGSAIGRTIGAVGSAPLKVVGSAIGRTAHNVGQSAAAAGAAAANKVRGVFGKAPVSVPSITKKKMGIGAIAATGIGVGIDASMYSPGIDKSTGRSKNVWDTLQQEPK